MHHMHMQKGSSNIMCFDTISEHISENHLICLKFTEVVVY